MPKLKKPISSDERIEARNELQTALDQGDIELGAAIKKNEAGVDRSEPRKVWPYRRAFSEYHLSG